MKKTALLIIILTIISKFIGLGREVVLSFYYGASNISDAYIIALTIPAVIFAFIGKGISTAYIPMYSKINSDFGVREANAYTNNLVNALSIICSVIVFLGLVFTKQIVMVFASGFEGETLALAVSFTRISLLGLYLTALIHVFIGFLQINGNYTIPALMGLPINFCIILSIFISSKGSIMVLAYGILGSSLLQLLFLIPFIVNKGFRYKPILDLKNPHITRMAYLALPIILGVAVKDINIIVDRTLASQIIEGGISALNYAGKINDFVHGIVVVSIATAMYPLISRMAAEKNIQGFKLTLAEAIGIVYILIIPATVGIMVLADPIVSLLFGRGSFDELAAAMTTSALFFYAIGMVGIGLREVLCLPFYAMLDTKTPMVNATIGMLLNIVLNLILSRYLGIGGVALGTSCAAILTSFLMFISLRKKIGAFGVKDIFMSFIKVVGASLIMGGGTRLSYEYLRANIFSQNISLLVAMGIGAIIYFVIIYFSKIYEMEVILNTIRNMIRDYKVKG